MCFYFVFLFSPIIPHDKPEQRNKTQNILTFNAHRKISTIIWKWSRKHVKIGARFFAVISWRIHALSLKYISSWYKVVWMATLVYLQKMVARTKREKALVFFWRKTPQLPNLNEWIYLPKPKKIKSTGKKNKHKNCFYIWDLRCQFQKSQQFVANRIFFIRFSFVTSNYISFTFHLALSFSPWIEKNKS